MISLLEVKRLGKEKSAENLSKLFELYDSITDIDIKREVVSSIGRQTDKKSVFNFIKTHVFDCGCISGRVVRKGFKILLF